MSEEPSCSNGEVRTEETPSTTRKEMDGTVLCSAWRSEPNVDKAAELYKFKGLSEHEKKNHSCLKWTGKILWKTRKDLYTCSTSLRTLSGAALSAVN
ncbi:hypothetical protein ATANTOWER_028773 [Ataeniobius toweri]|uniref:Uncharacterized protein n=1 Tax=Ataeniobius toweri TaxID=208326 RepID=A0ABU7CJT6_9TELE|nr:hypothetical protein [Ataeniobius toweri]